MSKSLESLNECVFKSMFWVIVCKPAILFWLLELAWGVIDGNLCIHLNRLKKAVMKLAVQPMNFLAVFNLSFCLHFVGASR